LFPIDDTVAQLTTKVKGRVAQRVNDYLPIGELNCPMAKTRVTRARQPTRPHFIPEWAERRGYGTQAELAEALGADKSVVSRWYDGATPGKKWQKKLVALFHCQEPDGIFRHPDDDWLAKFFRDRSEDEVLRAKQLLETAFPLKITTDQ
jgi:hypothetical protein